MPDGFQIRFDSVDRHIEALTSQAEAVRNLGAWVRSARETELPWSAGADGLFGPLRTAVDAMYATVADNYTMAAHKLDAGAEALTEVVTLYKKFDGQ